MQINPEVLVNCKSCGKPIGPLFLPQPYGEGSPTAITVGAFPQYVACPHCGHVYGYRTADMSFHEVGTPDTRPMPKNRISVRTRRMCRVDGCNRVMIIHTTMAAGTPLTELKLAPSGWKYHIWCGNGHEVQNVPLTDYDFEGVDTPPQAVN